MSILIHLINSALQIYILVIILQVILSWLIAFDLVNASNEQAKKLGALLKKLTDPIFIPIRKYVPPIGGIDITPIIVILGLQLCAQLLIKLLIGIFY